MRNNQPGVEMVKIITEAKEECQTEDRKNNSQPVKQKKKNTMQRQNLFVERSIKTRNCRKVRKYKRISKTQRKKGKIHNLSILLGTDTSIRDMGVIEAEEILSLGKDLGLDPIFSDNDTLSIIKKRLSRT